MAIWQRDHDGHPVDAEQLIHHSDAGSQYTSIRYTNRLLEAGALASIGTIGDSYDNALAETVNGLYKTECIRRDGPFRTLEALELATCDWVHWFNHQRLHSHCGDRPPAEYEAAYAAQPTDQQLVGNQ